MRPFSTQNFELKIHRNTVSNDLDRLEQITQDVNPTAIPECFYPQHQTIDELQ